MLKLAALIATIATITGATYHAGFKSAIPAPNASVASPAMISVTFTEPVMAPPISSFTLLKADSTVAMKLSVTAKAGDKKTIEAVVPTALAPGRYIVKWKNGAADDGHPFKGAFAFTVTAAK